jgi:hypothetical protein
MPGNSTIFICSPSSCYSISVITSLVESFSASVTAAPLGTTPSKFSLRLLVNCSWFNQTVRGLQASTIAPVGPSYVRTDGDLSELVASHRPVGTFNPAIAPRVGDRRVVNINHVVLAEKSQKADPVKATRGRWWFCWATEAMCYFLDELSCFIQHDLGYMLDFNPLGEFVYDDKDMVIVVWSGFKWTYGIETPHGEGQDGGIVCRTWVGRCCCLAKNWHPLHLLTRSLASFMAVDQ